MRLHVPKVGLHLACVRSFDHTAGEIYLHSCIHTRLTSYAVKENRELDRNGELMPWPERAPDYPVRLAQTYPPERAQL